VVNLHLGYTAGAIGYMIGIALLSSGPEESAAAASIGSAFWDLLHVPLFGGLAMCLLLAVTGGQWSCRVPWRLYAGITAIAVGYAAFDEWYQAFVPGRYSSAMDFALNCVGVAGLVLVHRLAMGRVSEPSMRELVKVPGDQRIRKQGPRRGVHREGGA
jgi:VanZ family protein